MQLREKRLFTGEKLSHGTEFKFAHNPKRIFIARNMSLSKPDHSEVIVGHKTEIVNGKPKDVPVFGTRTHLTYYRKDLLAMPGQNRREKKLALRKILKHGNSNSKHVISPSS